jgi:ATP-dependent protease ClpP protease subunit
MENWFKFVKASPDSLDIHILDFIGDWMDDYWGFGVTARSFITMLNEIPTDVKSLRVLINSPGGDVFSGLTIANALREQNTKYNRAVETHVIGLAASSASIIAMAGNPVSMSDNALMMIHNPWGFTIGEARDHRAQADMLDTTRETIVSTYRWHTTKSRAEIKIMMDSETFLTATEAIADGFATRKVDQTFEKSLNRFPPAVIAKLKIPHRHAALARVLTQQRTEFTITKSDPLKKQCFGWASVAVTTDDTVVVDAHDHIIEPQELEQAAYQFNLIHREMDEDHAVPVTGQLIESLVVTPDKLRAMGLSPNALPLGWWVGFQITDDAVFSKVVSGEYCMFSIKGRASFEDEE